MIRRQRPWERTRFYQQGPYQPRRKYVRVTGQRRREDVIMVDRPRRQTANAKANRALRLLRKFDKDREVKFMKSMTATMQIPIGGNWIVEGFGPYASQGDADNERIGNEVVVRSLAMRINIQLTALEALGTSVRLCLVYDRTPSGANATSANMFITDNQINSLYNYVYPFKGRFQFLYDKTYDISAQDGNISDKIFIQGNQKVKYSGNAGTVADVQKGNFLLLAMAEANAAAINVDYGFIFRFVDD